MEGSIAIRWLKANRKRITVLLLLLLNANVFELFHADPNGWDGSISGRSGIVSSVPR